MAFYFTQLRIIKFSPYFNSPMQSAPAFLPWFFLMSSSYPLWLTRLQPHCLPCSSSKLTSKLLLQGYCLHFSLPRKPSSQIEARLPQSLRSLSPLPYLFSSSKRSPSLQVAKLGPPTPSLSPFPCTCCTFFHSGVSPLYILRIERAWYLLHRFTPHLSSPLQATFVIPAAN